MLVYQRVHCEVEKWLLARLPNEITAPTHRTVWIANLANQRIAKPQRACIMTPDKKNKTKV